MSYKGPIFTFRGAVLLLVHDVVMKRLIRIRHMNEYRIVDCPSEFVACTGRPRFIEFDLKIGEIGKMVSEFQGAAQVDFDFSRSLAWIGYYHLWWCSDGITMPAHTYARFLGEVTRLNLPGNTLWRGRRCASPFDANIAVVFRQYPIPPLRFLTVPGSSASGDGMMNTSFQPPSANSLPWLTASKPLTADSGDLFAATACQERGQSEAL
jgi:hypothetical protein